MSEAPKLRTDAAKCLAEAIGTYFMVLFGCGSMVLAEIHTGYDGGFVPVIWGGVVAAMIYALGHVSGAHFNPAVTLSFWALGRFKAAKVPGYIVAQCLGAIAAAATLGAVWTADHHFGGTYNSLSPAAGFGMEFIQSFALMFVIAAVATDSRAVGEMAGFAIGLTVALCAFVGGPVTNASMNPARSLGPALLSGDTGQLWLYILAPICGAVAGALTYDWLRKHTDVDRKNDGKGRDGKGKDDGEAERDAEEVARKVMEKLESRALVRQGAGIAFTAVDPLDANDVPLRQPPAGHAVTDK